MKLSVTLIAGGYRAPQEMVTRGLPYFEQPGDLIVQVTVDDIGNRPYTTLIGDMLRAAEASLQRQLSPVIGPKGLPSDH